MKKQSTRHPSTNTETSKVMVSIVMPVYNASATVSSTIKSILAQQFVNWELLALDDGSTDNSTEIISSFNDPRIRLINCEHNYISTLNRGFAEATGKYIARMDADDLMVPERLMIQVAIMEKRKDIDVCSSWMETFGEDITNKVSGQLFGKISTPIFKLLGENFVYNPTVMIRRSFIEEHKIRYRDGYQAAEDYKFFFEMATLNAQFYVEAQPLLFYRLSKQQVSIKYRSLQENNATKVRWEITEYMINTIKENDQIMQLYTLLQGLVEKEILPCEIAVQLFYLILKKILQGSRDRDIYTIAENRKEELITTKS